MMGSVVFGSSCRVGRVGVRFEGRDKEGCNASSLSRLKPETSGLGSVRDAIGLLVTAMFFHLEHCCIERRCFSNLLHEILFGSRALR